MRVSLVVLLIAVCSPAYAVPRSVELELGRERWTISAPGAKQTHDKYTYRFTAKSWTIVVAAWPTSSVFIQTIDEQLEALQRRHPDLVVVQQEQRMKSDWVLVVEFGGKVHGVVLRPGFGDNAMCTFDVAAKDSKVALTACRSLERTRRIKMS
jgi:hypothetical protein